MSGVALPDPVAMATSAIDAVESAIRAGMTGPARQPFVVGLCGAQGSGKTTMATGLAARFNRAGIRTTVLSLDDLYLGAAERRTLGGAVHPLFTVRGVPGTHDVELGLSLIERLGQPGVVAMPSFDKSTDDRAPGHDWPSVEAPVSLVIFEGWCVGARPQAAAALVEPVNRLEAERDRAAIWRRTANDALAGPYQRLFGRIDLLVLLAAPAFAVVRAWRQQQEDDLRARSPADASGIMTSAQIGAFVQYYERLTRHILAEMPHYADLTLQLDEARAVTSVHSAKPRAG